MPQEELTMQTESIETTYPMYQRYWCCGRHIGEQHAPDCPATPTPETVSKQVTKENHHD